MAKILGLDLGTNSIGWALVDTQNDNNQIIDKGVRIFSEGVKIEKGVESSKAAERTGFRSARKLKFRRKLRKINTLKVLIKNNMCPLEMGQIQLWKDKKVYPLVPEFMDWQRTHEDKNPYFFRAKAVEKKLSSFDLGRVFYHLSQRRGFLSNRLEAPTNDDLIETTKQQIEERLQTASNHTELYDELTQYFKDLDISDEKVKKLKNAIEKILKSKNIEFEDERKFIENILNKKENLGPVKKAIQELTEKIEISGCKTMGQYFYTLYQKGERIRNQYTHREEHYKHEFDEICRIQELSEKLKSDLYKAIFYQRPLRSQKGLVGKCTFEPSKARCPISHPEFEKFRMLCFINNIKVRDNEKSDLRPLNKIEREKIKSKFYRRSKPSFEFADIIKELKIKETDSKIKLINFPAHTSVSGNPVSSYFKDLFGNDWEKVNIKYEYINPEGKVKECNANINDIWHVLFTYESNEKLKEFAEQKLKLTPTQTALFLRTPIKQGYANLSLKAIKKINIFLEEGYIYTFAAFVAKIPDIVGEEIWLKNQKQIKETLYTIIEGHNDYKLRKQIVNDLIGWHKNEFANAHSKYELDETDKKAIIDKIISFYGGKTWTGKTKQEQDSIEKEITTEFINCLHNSHGLSYAFAKIDRVDEKIKTYLKVSFNLTDKEISKIYHPSDVEMYKASKENPKDGKRYLGSPLVASVKNPVAMKTLHQLRYLINALIKDNIIDAETQINIELARDLNDANVRKAIETYQRQNEQKRMEYVNKTKEHFGKDYQPSADEILKYQLWEEQNHICLYTGGSIGIAEFIGADPKYDIEHTVPRSLSYDNSQMNLTLCENKFNRDIKKNKIPTELSNHKEILPRIESWQKKIGELHYKIENTKKASRAASTKEAKDRAIQQRHVLRFEYDYWKGKYDRFTMTEVKEGFKNSQLNDTRIMTKFARAYLKTIFDKVYPVKGTATAAFRKLWGIQEYNEKKERVNHIHHAIDAITIACMTKSKYDLLAKFYQADEHNNKREVHELLARLKPWETFVQDVQSIETDTFIYHHTDDNVTKQSKKKLRKRGKIQYTVNEQNEKQPVYLQGDTVRGSLHKDSVYGAIKQNDVIRYVIRKNVEDLKPSDIENIVDNVVKEKIKEFVKNDGIGILKKEIWMNKEKGVRIKKVRCFTPSVTNPIKLKTHRDVSKQDYKQSINVTNDSNYLMGIYNGINKKGKVIRDFEIVNYLEAGTLSKFSKIEKNKPVHILSDYIIKDNTELKLYQILKPGLKVILYENDIDEIWDLDNIQLNKRLYIITGLSSFQIKNKYDFGAIVLKHHGEARPSTHPELKVQSGDFEPNEKYMPVRTFLHSRFNAAIESKDFTISPTGKIKRME